MNKNAIGFAGSFNPLHIGHIRVIEKILLEYERVHILVRYNPGVDIVSYAVKREWFEYLKSQYEGKLFFYFIITEKNKGKVYPNSIIKYTIEKTEEYCGELLDAYALNYKENFHRNDYIKRTFPQLQIVYFEEEYPIHSSMIRNGNFLDYQTFLPDFVYNSLVEMREVNSLDYPVIGTGALTKVYKIDDYTALKLFIKGVSKKDAYNEYIRAKILFQSGVKTPMPYGIVRFEEMIGIEYELIKGNTIAEIMNQCDDYEDLGHIFEQIVSGLETIHSTNADKDIFKSIKQYYITTVSNLRCIPKTIRIEMIEAMNIIPERHTVVHGDLHPKNIMIVDGTPFFIDMGEAGYAHPIIDFLAPVASLELKRFANEDVYYSIMGTSYKEIEQYIRLILHYYLLNNKNVSDETKDSVYDVIRVYSKIWAVIAFDLIGDMASSDAIPCVANEFSLLYREHYSKIDFVLGVL